MPEECIYLPTLYPVTCASCCHPLLCEARPGLLLALALAVQALALKQDKKRK